jgi:hypothetical protein
MVLPVVNATARLAVPDKVPVMVPAEKLPLCSPCDHYWIITADTTHQCVVFMPNWALGPQQS